MKNKSKVTTTVTKLFELTLTRSDLVEIFRKAGHKVSADADFGIELPYGEDATVAEEYPLVVRWTESKVTE